MQDDPARFSSWARFSPRCLDKVWRSQWAEFPWSVFRDGVADCRDPH